MNSRMVEKGEMALAGMVYYGPIGGGSSFDAPACGGSIQVGEAGSA